ncbi:MAG TPA: phosphoenolpyruvate carboxykinase (ATP), partial [Thermomicrobiales bacterium]|nr:phosphoenolpyruvate carboxykinase (ATP) [Thermomicrobiales bacterium]
LAERPVWNERLAVGADPSFRYAVDLRTERAWVALFSRHLFVRSDAPETAETITVLHAPGLTIDPADYGTRSSTVIALHLGRRVIVIAGTAYAGEVKKAVFTLMQYLLPERGIVTMHCSAAVDSSNRTTLFFGLSGTGKTTLSTDPAFRLVGDDEHGWSEAGIFNLEAGSYAKTLHLSPEREPAIHAAATRAGTVLENVVLDDERTPDFDDDSLAENARAAYPIDFIPNAVVSGLAPHPSQIVLLTADATGVLPPVSRLTREQAIGIFLLGFTSKVAGTERGVTEPEMTFSPAFGAPFLPLPPERYAELLVARIDAHHPTLWLVNTGWTGGSYASGASRISLPYTRAIVQAIVDGRLERESFHEEPVFGLTIPVACGDIPPAVLAPIEAWASRSAFEAEARQLKQAFQTGAAEMGIKAEWTRWLD